MVGGNGGDSANRPETLSNIGRVWFDEGFDTVSESAGEWRCLGPCASNPLE
jgi:hypothetical protein